MGQSGNFLLRLRLKDLIIFMHFLAFLQLNMSSRLVCFSISSIKHILNSFSISFRKRVRVLKALCIVMIDNTGEGLEELGWSGLPDLW